MPLPNIIQKDLNDIVEDEKSVLMRFNSFRKESSSSLLYSSFPKYSNPRNSFYCSKSEVFDKDFKVNFKTPVPEYENGTSPPQSPTASQMQDFSSINTISCQEFEIDKDYLRRDFNSPPNFQIKN